MHLLVLFLLPSCLLVFWVLQTSVRHHFGHLSDPHYWNKEEVLPRWSQNITNCMLPFLLHFWKGKNTVMENGTTVRNWGRVDFKWMFKSMMEFTGQWKCSISWSQGQLHKSMHEDLGNYNYNRFNMLIKNKIEKKWIKKEVFPDTFIPESETGKQLQYYHLRFYTNRYGGLLITYWEIISLAFMGLTHSDCETRLTVNSKFFILLYHIYIYIILNFLMILNFILLYNI